MLVPAEYEINLAIQLAEGLIANNISTKLVLSDDFSQYTLPRIKVVSVVYSIHFCRKPPKKSARVCNSASVCRLDVNSK